MFWRVQISDHLVSDLYCYLGQKASSSVSQPDLLKLWISANLPTNSGWQSKSHPSKKSRYVVGIKRQRWGQGVGRNFSVWAFTWNTGVQVMKAWFPFSLHLPIQIWIKPIFPILGICFLFTFSLMSVAFKTTSSIINLQASSTNFSPAFTSMVGPFSTTPSTRTAFFRLGTISCGLISPGSTIKLCVRDNPMKAQSKMQEEWLTIPPSKGISSFNTFKTWMLTASYNAQWHGRVKESSMVHFCSMLFSIREYGGAQAMEIQPILLPYANTFQTHVQKVLCKPKPRSISCAHTLM